jgi:GT2 family glycosyltransferase
MNFGASLAKGQWLLLVNSDTIFAPGSLVALYHALLSQPYDVGMVGPVTNAAGNGQNYKIGGNENEVLAKAKFIQEHPCHAFIPCYRLDFFCVAIRRSLWEQLHGLDPIFGIGYYEDTDFCMRVKAINSRMIMCEDAFVYHAGSASFSGNPKARKLIKRNKKIFLRRHPDAVLYHQREGNLQALEEYIKLKQGNQWNEGLELRSKLRVDTLLTDLPRSPFKKWLWKRKVNRVLINYIDKFN